VPATAWKTMRINWAGDRLVVRGFVLTLDKLTGEEIAASALRVLY
jgi:hypothetical protein